MNIGPVVGPMAMAVLVMIAWMARQDAGGTITDGREKIGWGVVFVLAVALGVVGGTLVTT